MAAQGWRIGSHLPVLCWLVWLKNCRAVSKISSKALSSAVTGRYLAPALQHQAAIAATLLPSPCLTLGWPACCRWRSPTRSCQVRPASAQIQSTWWCGNKCRPASCIFAFLTTCNCPRLLCSCWKMVCFCLMRLCSNATAEKQRRSLWRKLCSSATLRPRG